MQDRKKMAYGRVTTSDSVHRTMMSSAVIKLMACTIFDQKGVWFNQKEAH
jgi:hypothetical protein